MTNTFNTWGEGSLIPLANDKKNRILVHGHYNRAVMYIDIVLGFNTFMEQTNWMSYIHNMIPIQHNFFIKAPLELYIPDEFNALLSNLSKTPIIDEESVHKYITYLNSIWYHPITYKLKGGSNSDEFFMYYVADIDTVVQEPTANQGIKDGQIHRNFDIAFTVRCEFNTIGYFMLNSPELKHNQNISCNNGDKAIIPIFTDTINLDDFHLPVGWTILGFPIFKLQLNENTISIDNVLNNSIRTVLDNHLKLGIPVDRFIKFQFRENGSILKDESFYIDWHNRVLHILNPNPHRTYRLLITVSYDYINEMVKKIYNLE
jgi:hypothetical protein